MLPTLLRPSYWAGHLLMVVCVGIAVVLGTWQLDAWSTRRADEARDISNAKPVTLASLMDGDSSFPGRSVGRPVTFSGTWVNDRTLYIDDRYLDDERGYWVVTPVRPVGSTSVVPVVRGWSPKASAAEPTGEVEITGWLQATEAAGPVDPDPTDDILPVMRLASMAQPIGFDLYSGYVVARDQAPAATDGLSAVSATAVPPVSGFTALRNLLYAVEWWVFGAFAFFVWVRWCRDSLHPLDEVETETEVTAAPQ